MSAKKLISCQCAHHINPTPCEKCPITEIDPGIDPGPNIGPENLIS